MKLGIVSGGGWEHQLQGCEFHTWRLPSEGLWDDILQKFAAAGLNTVSIYGMGLVNPVKGRTNWSGFRALQPIFKGAQKNGLWVIVRPGPYINAGGIPGWVTQLDCPLRTNASDFDEAWRQYWIELAELVEPNQVGKPNGTVLAVQIENEILRYLSDAHSFEGQPAGKDGYMRDLVQSLKENGIYVPLTFNDAGMDENFVRGTGSVDIYGFDSYPQSFNCSNPSLWKPVMEDYAKYQSSLQLNSPLYIPEFQGGAFDPWGPHAAGYDQCQQLTGSNFQSVFNLNNLAANAKMISYYVSLSLSSLHGLWRNFLGVLTFPGVYTSYDYGAPISEDRTLNEKFTELKRQSLFLRSTKDFYMTDIVSDSHKKIYCIGQDESGFVTELRNRDTGAAFYILRATDSTSNRFTVCTLRVLTSAGPIELPTVVLRPRRSKILVTDYITSTPTPNLPLNKLLYEDLRIRLLYTTSNVLLSAHIGGQTVLYLFSDDQYDNQASSTSNTQTSVLQLPGYNSGLSISKWTDKHFNVTLQKSAEDEGYLNINWAVEQPEEVVAIQTSQSAILLTSEKTAGQVWNPILESNSSTGVVKDSLLVWGPYLVRNASVVLNDAKFTLHIWGDTSVSVYIGGLNVQKVSWNGETLKTLVTSRKGFLRFDLYPNNLEWKYRDSLPEINEDFNDDDWVNADHNETVSPYKKLFGKYYLYACDYGFCNGGIVWRGHFDSVCDSDPAQLKLKDQDLSGIRLAMSGGSSFAASVWINDVLIKTTVATDSRMIEEMYIFPENSIEECGHNIITIVQDSMGMDQTEEGFSDTVKHPRGILGYRFENVDLNQFGEIKWKLQGQLGGFYWLPDPDRGIMNENGFFGIRSGWHLPNYPLRNSSEWIQSSPITNGMNQAGIGFYHTEIDLDLPRGYDMMISLNFGQVFDQGNQEVGKGRYRVEFWVNGWHMGRYVSDLGPQFRFPIHEGILNFQGSNELGLTLWAMDRQGAKIEKLCSNPEFEISKRSNS
ncbi:family 35 glycoside hydrolase [Melampsora americana]|nr:family 35 glycoside hydrolase [Melampsora americana]